MLGIYTSEKQTSKQYLQEDTKKHLHPSPNEVFFPYPTL